MSIPKNILREYPALGDWAILTAWRGSIAHNMYVPQSNPDSIDDKDVMSVCVPPLDYFFGMKQFGSRGTQEIKRDEWDIVVYEIKKFIGLLAGGNPNVLSLLWLEENHYIKRTPAAHYLIDNRDAFVGRHVYRSFSGYAHAQLHKMENMAFEGYMGQKRKSLVEKFGYDCKNAAHCIRLLRMGIEFLKDGRLYVFRHDAPELLSIKRGEWGLERVKKEAEYLFKKADEAYMQSTLPVDVDNERVNEICKTVVSMTLGAI